MLVTIFSDAGLCPELNLGSWGAWIKSKRGVARGGGVLRENVHDTSVAEARAVLNAIHLGLCNGVIAPGDHLIVQTDNIAVPNVLNGAKTAKKKGKKAQNPVTMAQKDATHEACAAILAKNGLTIEWRHVKGHQGTGTKRSSVNTFCDKVASFFLRLERHIRAPERFTRQAGLAPFGIRDPRTGATGCN